MSKKTGKSLSGKHNQKILIHAKQSATYALKAALKKQFKKQLKETVIWLVMKSLIKIQKFQKLHNWIAERGLEMNKKI